MQPFKSIVFELTLYYMLLAISLPLVYAVTYHLPIMGIFTTRWLIISLVIYPVVFFFSALRYSYQRIRSGQQRNEN